MSKNNQTVLDTVKKLFRFDPKTKTTTTASTETFTLSKSDSRKFKSEICKTVSGASENMLKEAFNNNIYFAQECNHEFECDHIGDSDSE